MTSDPEPCIVLFSSGLLSRHGFDDGDEPDAWLDYCEDRGVTQPPSWRYELLPRLVREHLLPALDQEVEIVIISCNHNSVRASTVDGRNAEHEWSSRAEPAIRLTPEQVSVPFSAVFAMAREATAPGRAP